MLAAGNEPDFRKQHLQVLEVLFVQVLRLALKLGVMKIGRVGLDGSKVKANASKHKAMKRKLQRLESTGGSLPRQDPRHWWLVELSTVARDEEFGGDLALELSVSGGKVI